MMQDIGRQVQLLATSLDADYYGVVDLTVAHDFIRAQGGNGQRGTRGAW